MDKGKKEIYYFENLPQGIKSESLYCIIDVNLNRAKEGLRVVEEIVRFVFRQKDVYIKIKETRLKLYRVAKNIYPDLIYARRVNKDIAVKIKEKNRKNLKELLIANFKRVEEALRVLEEFSKLISCGAGYKFKRMRFDIYELEKKVVILFLEKSRKRKKC
ncbi:thiamine-phosphate pyrophosphorylase [bacterium]|nr:thiamine-phosphate pyrophosphorylase [bacterium]